MRFSPVTMDMVTLLDWLATVSQPIIAALLTLAAYYLREGRREMQEIKEDNRFFHKAIKGDERLGFPGLMKRTNDMKRNQNTLASNQKELYQQLAEYDIVEGDIEIPERVNGPEPDIEDLSYDD